MFNQVSKMGAVVIALILFPQPAYAQSNLSDGVRDLAAQIANSARKEQKRRIAVVSFRELDGRATVFGALLAEELTTTMFSEGAFEIVERSMLDRVLAEMKLASSGIIDADTARQLGQLTGIDAVVTGSITDLESYVAVNCRMIETATGRVFAAAQVRIVKDPDIRKILSLAYDDSNTRTATAVERANLPSSVVGEQDEFVDADAGEIWRLVRCSRQSGGVQADPRLLRAVTCSGTLTVSSGTTGSRSRRTVGIVDLSANSGAEIDDDTGTSHPIVTFEMANVSLFSEGWIASPVTVVPDTPVPFQITARGFAASAMIVQVTIPVHDENSRTTRQITFSSIPLR